MIVTIHQPEHMVWLGFLHNLTLAEVFVIFDDTQFKKHYFENRNKIRTKDGSMWLTVPVKDQPLSTRIKDTLISHETEWIKKYLQSLKTHYGGTPYFKDYYPKIEQIFQKKHEKIVDLNIEIIEFLMEEFGVKPLKIIKSSELNIPDHIKGSDICLEICKRAGASKYLSGVDGVNYLKLDDFEKEGIEVIFHKFDHPKYEQIHGEFMPGMSSIDALFHLGPNAKKLLGL